MPSASSIQAVERRVQRTIGEVSDDKGAAGHCGEGGIVTNRPWGPIPPVAPAAPPGSRKAGAVAPLSYNFATAAACGANNAMIESETDGQRAGEDQREVEWHLATSDLGAVQRWISAHHVVDGLRLEPRPSIEVHDTYLDSSDWRIQRAGFALRVRSAANGSEATLKELSSARADV